MGSNPIIRPFLAYLAELVDATDLKFVPFQGVGSSPIVSNLF